MGMEFEKLTDLPIPEKQDRVRGNKNIFKVGLVPYETAETANFHFCHYESMETFSCHSNEISQTRKLYNDLRQHLESDKTMLKQTVWA